MRQCLKWGKGAVTSRRSCARSGPMEISRGYHLVFFRSLLYHLVVSICGELTQPDSRLSQVAGSSTPPSLCGLFRPYCSMAPYLKMNRRDPWPSVNQESTPRNNWWAPCLWLDTRPGLLDLTFFKYSLLTRGVRLPVLITPSWFLHWF